MFPDVDDDGSTGAFVGRMSLNAARLELETAGGRQREIDGLIAVESKKLETLAAERAAKGRGRPNTSHSSKVKAAGAKIARLMRNILPSEQAPYVPRSMLELVSSAAKHPQHHRCEQQVRTDGREAATLLSQSVTICIQAWFTLEEANYRRLQQQLRTRIEPPPVMEAPTATAARADGRR